jgi:hypothetical protein
MTLESYITQLKQTQNILETITIIEITGILLTTPTAFQNGMQHVPKVRIQDLVNVCF